MTSIPLPILFLIAALFLAQLMQPCQSLRVLVSASNMFRSHLAMHVSIADVLVTEGGHEVTMLVPIWNHMETFPPRNHTNWTKSQHVILADMDEERKQIFAKMFKESALHQPNIWTENVEIFGEKNLHFLEDAFTTACKAVLTDTQLHATLRAQHFDVAIAEFFDCCSLGVFHLLNIPAVVVTSAVPMSTALAKMFGIPSPAYIPDINFSPPEGTSMNIVQRARNFIDSYRQENSMNSFIDKIWEKTIVPAVGQRDFPKSHDAFVVKASFILINSNEFLDMAKPISAKVKHIGGFTLQRNKSGDGNIGTMDARTTDLLENSSAGTVLVSFGSVADPRHMPTEMRQAFLDAFAAFPSHTFIWKFSQDNDDENTNANDDDACVEGAEGSLLPIWAGGVECSRNSTSKKFPPNVHRFEWMDQRGILAHPKLRLFISHCGLNSVNEAAFEGVPVLCIPLFGDQNYNAAMVNQRRIGRLLAKDKLTSANLRATLHDLLANGGENEYAQNMQTLSRKMAHAPFQPRDIIVRYVQFASEFGGNFDELNLEGANMSTFAQIGLDFLLPIALTAAAAFAILAYIFVTLVRRNYRWIVTMVMKATFEGDKQKVQ